MRVFLIFMVFFSCVCTGKPTPRQEKLLKQLDVYNGHNWNGLTEQEIASVINSARAEYKKGTHKAAAEKRFQEIRAQKGGPSYTPHSSSSSRTAPPVRNMGTAGPALQAREVPPPPLLPSNPGPERPSGMGDLLASIRGGKKLKKTEGPKTSSSKGGLDLRKLRAGRQNLNKLSGSKTSNKTVLSELSDDQVDALDDIEDEKAFDMSLMLNALIPLSSDQRKKFIDGLKTTSDFVVYKREFYDKHLPKQDQSTKAASRAPKTEEKKGGLTKKAIDDAIKAYFYQVPGNSLKESYPTLWDTNSLKRVHFQDGNGKNIPQFQKVQALLDRYFDQEPFKSLREKMYERHKKAVNPGEVIKSLRVCTNTLKQFFTPFKNDFQKVQSIEDEIEEKQQQIETIEKRVQARGSITEKQSKKLKAARKKLSRLLKQTGARNISAFSKRNVGLNKKWVTLGGFSGQAISQGRARYKVDGDTLKNQEYKISIEKGFTPLTPYEATRTLKEWGDFNPSQREQAPESVVLYWKILFHAASECLSGDGTVLPNSRSSPVPKRQVDVTEELTDSGTFYTYTRMIKGKSKGFKITKKSFDRTNKDPRASLQYVVVNTIDKRSKSTSAPTTATTKTGAFPPQGNGIPVPPPLPPHGTGAPTPPPSSAPPPPPQGSGVRQPSSQPQSNERSALLSQIQQGMELRKPSVKQGGEGTRQPENDKSTIKKTFYFVKNGKNINKDTKAEINQSVIDQNSPDFFEKVDNVYVYYDEGTKKYYKSPVIEKATVPFNSFTLEEVPKVNVESPVENYVLKNKISVYKDGRGYKTRYQPVKVVNAQFVTMAGSPFKIVPAPSPSSFVSKADEDKAFNKAMNSRRRVIRSDSDDDSSDSDDDSSDSDWSDDE